MALLQGLLFGRSLQDFGNHISLATIINASRINIVFAIAFVSLLAFVALRFIMNYTPSKSIYALLTLPIKRKHVYWAKLVAALLAGVVLLAAQMLLILVFNTITSGQEASVLGEYEIVRRNADLYLTLLDSSFLRMLFPPDIYSLLFTVFGLFGSISVMLYVTVAAKAGKKASAFVSAGVWITALFLIFPLPENTLFFGNLGLTLMVAYLFATCKQGIKLFEKGEVTG